MLPSVLSLWAGGLPGDGDGCSPLALSQAARCHLHFMPAPMRLQVSVVMCGSYNSRSGCNERKDFLKYFRLTLLVWTHMYNLLHCNGEQTFSNCFAL